jgi:DNA-binding MarR family transcriptional regulator
MGEALKKRLKQSKFQTSLQEALLNVMVASGFVHEFTEKICSPFGITGVQYNLLRILRGVYPEGHPRWEIAERMIERAPDVTRLIDRMEAQGLVERVPSKVDRRQSVTKITKKGLDVVSKIPLEKEVQKFFGKRITGQDKQELIRICEKIYGNEKDESSKIKDHVAIRFSDP